MPKPDFTYDPSLPVRDPRTKGFCPHADLVLDMAAVIAICVKNNGDGRCYEAQLIGAGFTPAEIARAGDEARVKAAERLRPSVVDDDLIEAMADRLLQLPSLRLRPDRLVSELVDGGFAERDAATHLDRAVDRAGRRLMVVAA